MTLLYNGLLLVGLTVIVVGCKDDAPKNASEAFSKTAPGEKQTECNGKGFIVDHTENPSVCDSIPVAKWPCSMEGFEAGAKVADLSTQKSEMKAKIADGYNMEQCGEIEKDGKTIIKIIFMKKTLNGDTFTAQSEKLTLEYGENVGTPPPPPEEAPPVPESP